MKIHEIMSKNVECIEPSLPIAKAAEKMRDIDVGFLPICENDKLTGAVTDREITIADFSSFVRWAAADLLLDGVQCSDSIQCLFGGDACATNKS